jgi:hypothetical protein
MSLALKPPKKKESNHTKIWTLFLDCANDTFGEERVKRIFQRYAVDPQALSDQNAPLLAKHVRMLELGATLLRKKDLKDVLGMNPNASTLEQFLAEQSPVKPLNIDTSHLMGGPTNWSAFFLHNRYLMDRELQLLFSDVEDLSRNAYLERMFKSILPRELPVGLIVPAPHPSGVGVDFYEIYDVVTAGDGLVAYAFKPLYKESVLQPMVLFRASPFHFSAWDVFETWMNNLQKYVGWLGYQTARGKLSKLAHDTRFCPADKQMLVGGFSLGGTHAQLFTADHSGRISRAVFFNDPSADAETADLFASKINAIKQLPFPIKARLYRTEGDLANFAGEKHVFCGVDHPQVNIRLKVFTPKKALTAAQCHGWKHFDTNGVQNSTKRDYTDADDLERELDNSKRGDDVQLYENIRLFGSYFIFPIFFLWSRFFHSIETLTGFTIARHSDLTTQKT